MRFGLEVRSLTASRVALLLAVALSGQAVACKALSPSEGLAPGERAALAPLHATDACVLPARRGPDQAFTEAGTCATKRWLQAYPAGKPPTQPAGDAVPHGPAPLPDAAAAVPETGAWLPRPRWLLTERLRI